MSSFTLLFANNAITTLAAPLPASATSCALAAGTGALFPQPAENQGFYLTFNDALTGLISEIVLVTAMDGDNVQAMVRGVQATTPLNWLEGDTAAQFVTAGDMQAFMQAITGGGSLFITQGGQQINTQGDAPLETQGGS
jgi:hypothetical protein